MCRLRRPRPLAVTRLRRADARYGENSDVVLIDLPPR
jgi:hypothetical protein